MNSANPWSKIYDAIGDAAAWEQLSEEAAELSAITSKLARIIRGENPARMTLEEAYRATLAELADTFNALDVLECGRYDGLRAGINLEQPEKMTRWYKSLFGTEENIQ